MLSQAAEKLKRGDSVEVKVRKEPTNPKDSRAIVFDCKLVNSWEHIGYVAKEALESVHFAPDKNLIVSVQFDWI